ncbi:MAG: YqgE/AlgH family protein [Candidatus Puniceispirillales bacterium WSBS_2018_MAG_OTU23]
MSSFLNGQILIAMPQMDDPRFQGGVILVCSHDADHAVGIVVNKLFNTLKLADLADQIDIGTPRFHGRAPIYNGGPVEPTRGMVIHSSDHHLPDTKPINGDMAMTTNVKILNEIANNVGPSDFIIALGHASWTAGQLEKELLDNVWLTMEYEQGLIFDAPPESIWNACFNRLGISVGNISAVAGHA